jgi:hypothetical protein
MGCFRRSLDFGLKMGVGLTLFGKKSDLCTQNARDMNKKADFFKKMRKSDCICCVYLYKFYSARRGGRARGAIDKRHKKQEHKSSFERSQKREVRRGYIG